MYSLFGAIAGIGLQYNAEDVIALGSWQEAPHQMKALVQMRDRCGNQHPLWRFLPDAENSTPIEPVDQWELHGVFVYFEADLGARPQPWGFINIGAPALRNALFLTFLGATMCSSQIDPRVIQPKLFEASIICSIMQALWRMRAVREFGYLIALDDFETGFSKYESLKAFAPNRIKIDDEPMPNFVDLGKAERLLIKLIIRLAHHQNIEVVAERLSSSALLNAFCEFGIDKDHDLERGQLRPFPQLFGGRDRVQEQGRHVE